MALTIAEVEHVAALARLGLTAAEKQRMRDQLSSILDHIAVLDEIDTDAIPATFQVIEMTNVWREDRVSPSLARPAVLANAPRQQAGFFEVDSPLGGDDAGVEP